MRAVWHCPSQLCYKCFDTFLWEKELPAGSLLAVTPPIPSPPQVEKTEFKVPVVMEVDRKQWQANNVSCICLILTLLCLDLCVRTYSLYSVTIVLGYHTLYCREFPSSYVMAKYWCLYMFTTWRLKVAPVHSDFSFSLFLYPVTIFTIWFTVSSCCCQLVGKLPNSLVLCQPKDKRVLF